MIAGLMTVSLAVVVCATDRTWVGSGSDSNWNTPANWGGAAPVADDALYFGGTQRLVNTNDLPLTDPSFAGLTFNSGAGAFTLWGSRITLGGDVTNRSSNAQTINLPMILSATRAFNGSNAAITVNGILSGAGGLLACVTNSTLTLTGNNTYDGVTVVSNGTLLAITHANALGSTNGNTTVNCRVGGGLQLSGGIVVDEPLTFNGQRPNFGSSLLNSGGSNTVRGLITKVNEMRVNAVGGSTLVIAGGIQPSGGAGDLVLNPGGGTIIFNTAPINLGSSQFYVDQTGLEVIAVAGNTWGITRVAGGTVRTDIANALPATTTLYVGISYSTSGIFDLNRFDQTVSALATDTTNAGTRTVTSPGRATLTVNQSANTTYNGLLAGAVCLVKAGTGSLTFTNAVSTTTGDITVSNGTLVVEASAGFGASSNVVVAGGTLDLRTATSLPDGGSLWILDGGGAKVKIGTNLTETVNALFLGGVQQRRGTYGSSSSGASTLDDAHFSGSGKLYVSSHPPITATNYIWDAGGANTNLDSPTNWVGDVVPDFAGTSYVTFGSNGVTAVVNTNASLYGLAFNRDGNFTLANGTGALTLGMGGAFASAPTTTARAYTLAEDVTLIENQTWNITNVLGGTTLTVSGNIGDGDESLGITKIGSGALVLSGTNTYDGVTTNWVGSITVASSNALGSTLGGTVVNTLGTSSARLELTGGITLAEPLTFIGASVNGYCLQNVSGTNTITGLINSTGGRHAVNSGTTLIVAGGITNTPFFVINGSGTLIFRTTPLTLGSGSIYADDSGLTIVDVASNTWSSTTIAKGTVRMNVANALPAAAATRIGLPYGPSGILDLNGFNQTTTRLYSDATNAAVRGVTSATPATLTINQSQASSVFDGQFTGAVGLIKAGTGTMILTNSISTTTGDFTVSNGTLVVTFGSNLGNSTNITVVAAGTGTNTLSLLTSTSIANSATLSIANGGSAKVNLAAGVNESVGWLLLGGSRKSAGTYGATGSGALFIDTEHFAGTGILTVLRDRSGTLLRVQ
jgi:autotransporter-associated beta strand protein